MKPKLICDITEHWWSNDGPYEGSRTPNCPNLATYRYREFEHENWGYRCDAHERWLSPNVYLERISPQGRVMTMHYSDNPAHVRADRFRENGKWYDTIVLDMHPYYYAENDHLTPPEAVTLAYRDWQRNEKGAYNPHEPWTIVVLEPYHQFNYPVLITIKVDVE